MQPNIPAALRDLRHTADQIEVLLEWQKLAEQEQRRLCANSFHLYNDGQDDLYTLRAHFMSVHWEICEEMKRRGLKVSEKERRHWQRELESLEQRIASLC